MSEEWVGNVTGEIREVNHSDWYWVDEKCKTRCVTRFIHRKFVVYPSPPEPNDTVYIVKTASDEYVECYSDGTYLIAFEPIRETETIYKPSFMDKLKALFHK